MEREVARLSAERKAALLLFGDPDHDVRRPSFPYKLGDERVSYIELVQRLKTA